MKIMCPSHCGTCMLHQTAKMISWGNLLHKTSLYMLEIPQPKLQAACILQHGLRDSMNCFGWGHVRQTFEFEVRLVVDAHVHVTAGWRQGQTLPDDQPSLTAAVSQSAEIGIITETSLKLRPGSMCCTHAPCSTTLQHLLASRRCRCRKC